MRVFSEELMSRAAAACNIKDFRAASIMETSQASSWLEKETGIPFIHLELGSPGFSPNPWGVAAEKEAMDLGYGAQYPPLGGLPKARQAVSRFLKSFLDIELPADCCMITSGSMQGSLVSFISLTQRVPGKDKILFLNPCFSSQRNQLSMLGVGYRAVEEYGCRGEALVARIGEELSRGDIAALIYSNPSNPAWTCLEESELEGIAAQCERYDTIPIEDLAYFGMDFRHEGYGTPGKAPYPPTIARYTSRFVLLLSSSKIFSFAGQRAAAMCIGEPLAREHSPALAQRYHGIGEFAHTVEADLIDLMSCGTAMTVQYAFARMLELSCEGVIDFVGDTAEYGRRAARMKEIFLRHGFSVVYDRDLSAPTGDGFFFTLGYPGMSGAELASELVAYGVAVVNLKASGSVREGVRICSSRISGSQFDVLESRMSDFAEDHPSAR